MAFPFSEVDNSENKSVKSGWSELDSLGDQLLLLKLKHPENSCHIDGFNRYSILILFILVIITSGSPI